jgi:hypothetical protein
VTPLIPAQAGIQQVEHFWTPAFAGVSGVTSGEQFVPEIAPGRIILLDELNLPCAIPFFHLTFPEEGGLTALVLFHPYQRFDTVPFCKSGNDALAVLPNSFGNIIGHPDVERAVSTTG